MIKKTTLILSWHPTGKSIHTAGGFKRCFEIIKYSDSKVIILDKYPSIFSSLKNQNISIIEYGKHPFLYSFISRFVFFSLFIDRIMSIIELVFKGLQLKKRNLILYVPFSELPQLIIAATILKFITRSKIVCSNSNVNILYFDRLVNNFFHRYSDLTLTVSNSLKKDLETQGIKIDYVNGVGFDTPKSIVSKKSYKKYDAIFIGRHTSEKGIYDLIEIWNILVNKFDFKYSLITIGDLPDYVRENLISKIKMYNLSDYITIKGIVGELTKQELLEQSKIMVFPSKREGWGIAPMEALYMGLPVIAYDLAVYKESIGENAAFITIKEGDMMAFAESFIKVIKRINEYSDKAKKWRPLNSWKKISDKEWELIASVQ